MHVSDCASIADSCVNKAEFKSKGAANRDHKSQISLECSYPFSFSTRVDVLRAYRVCFLSNWIRILSNKDAAYVCVLLSVVKGVSIWE